MNDRDTLKARIDTLSPMAVRFVARLVDSLSEAPTPHTVTPTWLTKHPDWIEYFGLAVSAHHGATTEPLVQTSFETVFRNACQAVAWPTDPPGSATRRFVDMTVTPPDGKTRRLSLKSTAAKNLRERTAHISKLTEAAWIQDVRSAKARRQRTLELFRDYRGAVDAIILLRAFREPAQMPNRYQLVEIPSDLFKSLEDTPESAFAADGPVINCSYRGLPSAGQVAIDRSDAKITIRRIELAACTIHAEWRLVQSTAASSGSPARPD
ncbi:MAG: hypothetical protein F4X11_07775 [Acidobacteria bacterium]|nr:hypothetical protein [Acidobacteriota bacterium]